MTKPYRIKHKASGLYYQPSRNHSNLSKNGRVRMKKQIVLDEQDIKEFHEDAEHLRWLYNRMVSEHGESVNFDYMHRFAKIFNKLKQL